MKNTKLFVVVSLIATLTGSLSSCGNETKTGSKTIKFWHCLGQAKTRNLKKLTAKFNEDHKNTDGYQVELADLKGDYDTLDVYVKTKLNAGETPSITMGYPDSFSGYMGSRGVANSQILNLDDFIKDDSDFDSSSFVPAYWDEGKHYQYDGTWSVPMYKSTEAMYYNIGEFHKTNWYKTNKDKTENKTDVNGGSYTVALGDPNTWDWETLVTACTAIKEEKKSLSDFYALGYDSDSNLFISQMKQRGIQYTTASGNTPDAHYSFYNDASSKAALKELTTEIYGLTSKKIMATKTTYGSYSSDLFLQRKVMFTIGSTGGSAYNDPTGLNWSDGVGLAKVPAYKNNQQYILQGPSVCFFNTDDSAKEKVAWEYYSKYLSNDQLNAELALENSYDPVRKNSYDSKSYSNWTAMGLDENGNDNPNKPLKYRIPNLTKTLRENYFTSPVFIGSSVARKEIGKILDYVAQKEGNIDQAIEEVYHNSVLASK